jgi:hypothetical protein
MPLNRSTFLAAAGACIAAAAVSPAALAAGGSPSKLVKTGSFLGSMKPVVAGKSPSFVSFGFKGHELVEFSYKFALKCDDGTVRSTLNHPTTPPHAVKVGAKQARIAFTLTDQGTTITVKGVFGGTAARPTITGTVKAVDQTGSTTCHTAGSGDVSSFTNTWDTPNPSIA